MTIFLIDGVKSGGGMRTDFEEKILVKAIDAFGKSLIVVSPEFKIQAASCPPEGMKHSDIVGKYCHEVFYGRSSPCENLMPKPEEDLDIDTMPCHFAYPIFDDKRCNYYVSLASPATPANIENKIAPTATNLT